MVQTGNCRLYLGVVGGMDGMLFLVIRSALHIHGLCYSAICSALHALQSMTTCLPAGMRLWMI